MPNNNCAWYIVTVFSCLSLYFVRFYFLERRIARIRSNFYSNFLCIYSFLSCLSVSFSLSLRSIAVHCISINYFGIPCEKVQLKICRFFFFFLVLPFCLKLWLNRFGPVWFSVINGSWVMWLWHSFFLGSVCCCCCRTATDVALILLLHCFYFFFCVFVRLFWVGSFPRFCTSYRCVLIYCMDLWAAVTATVFTADDFNSYRNVTIFWRPQTDNYVFHSAKNAILQQLLLQH